MLCVFLNFIYCFCPPSSGGLHLFASLPSGRAILSVCGVRPSWTALYAAVPSCMSLIGSLSDSVIFKARRLRPRRRPDAESGVHGLPRGRLLPPPPSPSAFGSDSRSAQPLVSTSHALRASSSLFLAFPCLSAILLPLSFYLKFRGAHEARGDHAGLWVLRLSWAPAGSLPRLPPRCAGRSFSLPPALSLDGVGSSHCQHFAGPV